MNLPSNPRSFARFLAGCALALRLAAPATAEVLVDVGTQVVAPDRAHQWITLFAENTGPSAISVGGLDLRLEIGPGAPDSPTLGSVDLISGTLFESYAPTQTADPGNTPHLQLWYLTVPALGLYPEIPAATRLPLAILEFDTTGLADGNFTLGLGGTGPGGTLLYDSFGSPVVGLSIRDGSLRIGSPLPPPHPVPDNQVSPLTLLMLALALLTAGARCRRLAGDGQAA